MDLDVTDIMTAETDYGGVIHRCLDKNRARDGELVLTSK